MSLALQRHLDGNPVTREFHGIYEKRPGTGRMTSVGLIVISG